MIGIILSGGNGTRLFPSSKVISKQLHYVYDKPMIYYSLSTMMNLNIKTIIIITNSQFISTYKNLLGDGSHLGINLIFISQDKPNGIAESFILSKKYINNKKVCLLLGDNIFYSNYLLSRINSIKKNLNKNKASIVGYSIKNPNDYGVVKFKNNKIYSIIEKPKKFISNVAVTGIYFYPKNLKNYTNNMRPSQRGELEITSVNNKFLKNNLLELEILDDASMWMDLGNHASLLKGSQFIEAIEERKGFKIGCIEEIALKKNFIIKKDFFSLIKNFSKSNYTNYLKKLI